MESSCKKCGNSKIVKNGKSRNGEQRYLCKQCNYSFQLVFHYTSYRIGDFEIIQLTKEGCGIRSTARILGISPSTVLRRILVISRKIQRPYCIQKGKVYEVDELFTYVGNKKNRVCIAYSFYPSTGEIINFIVGRRNKSIELFSNKVIFQKINYIHQNPVEDTSTCSASSIIGRRI